MAASLIANTVQQGNASSSRTTSAIDTSGSTLLVIVAGATVAGGSITVSDSKTNVWHRIVTVNASDAQLGFFWSMPSSVGSGHTFTANGSVVSLAVQAWSGVIALPYGTGSANSGTTVTATNAFSSTISTGGTNLHISGFTSYGDGGAYTVGSSFTISDQCQRLAGNAIGVAAAYKQSASIESPQWTWVSSATNQASAAVVCFPISGSGGGSGGSGSFAFAG